MLNCKTFEIRDRATFIPAVGIDCGLSSGSLDDVYLLSRAGYGVTCRCILLTRLEGRGKSQHDPYDWGDRTWATAHNYIMQNWDDLPSGAVIDVEFILGERPAPKVSERFSD